MVAPYRLVRNGRHKGGVNAWRRPHMEYAPVTSARAQGFMKTSLEIPRAKTTSDVISAKQMLEELVRNYEEHRDKKYDNDLKLQRLYDILSKLIEQQLVLEDRNRSATYEWNWRQLETEETTKTTMEDKTRTRQET